MNVAELEALLLEQDVSEISRKVGQLKAPDIPLHLQPLLLHTQLAHWLFQHEARSHHSSAHVAHFLRVTWPSISDTVPVAASSPQQPTPAELIRLFYAAASVQGSELQHEFEQALVELKRQLFLDRLAHSRPAAELWRWLQLLFPLAHSAEPIERAPESLLGRVWQHAPSADAVVLEREVNGELEELIDNGADRETYLKDYSLNNFIRSSLKWLESGLQEWKRKRVFKRESAIAGAIPAPAASPARKKAVHRSAGALERPASPAAQSVPKPVPVTPVVPEWRFDHLVLTLAEIEKMLPLEEYVNFPVSAAESKAGLAAARTAGIHFPNAIAQKHWLARRAYLTAIHQQTLPEVAEFVRVRRERLAEMSSHGSVSPTHVSSSATSERSNQPSPTVRRHLKRRASSRTAAAVAATATPAFLTQAAGLAEEGAEEEAGMEPESTRDGSDTSTSSEDEQEKQKKPRAVTRKPSAAQRSRESAAVAAAAAALAQAAEKPKGIQLYFKPAAVHGAAAVSNFSSRSDAKADSKRQKR
jgi:hypothetical protein